ncbi:MAG: hypothetical protein DSZ03_00335 [Sulfurimonas sp.]|nr:MAG: hypothetical protein DSZ03_00335 [Sulfurimonas sp.]
MLGKCPYCEDGTVVAEKKSVLGKPTKVYRCSNTRFHTEDGECFESVGSCTYRIWGNALVKYGKRAIGEREVKELLRQGSFIAVLHSRNGYEYRKYVIPHNEYGIHVLFHEEVAS